MSSELSSNFLQFGLDMANGNGHSIYEFDHFRLDAAKLMLYSGEREIQLPPKVIKTLAVLVEKRGEILSKDELMARVWEDSIVEESNLSQYLYLLRKTLGQRPDGRPFIETLRRRGYRFTAHVDQVKATVAQPKPIPTIAGASQAVGVERHGNVLRLVDWIPEVTPAAETPGLQANAGGQRFKSTYFAASLLAVLVLAVSLSGIIYFWFRPNVRGARVNKEVSVQRLTNGVMPGSASISRDGNYFAYTGINGESSELWLQAVGQSGRLRIGESTDKTFASQTFTPDGRYLYYTLYDRQNSEYPSTYRIPAMGGPASKVLDGVRFPISFSPDGENMVFYREDAPSGSMSLVTADNVGQNEKVLLMRSEPIRLSGSPAWSPDGATVIFSECGPGGSGYSNRNRIYAVDLASGTVKLASQENWDTVYRTEWAHDGRGLFIVATRENDVYSARRDQVYYISYPEGVSRRVTTDGVRHEPGSLGITDDGGILALATNRSTQIWAISSNGDVTGATQLSRGLYDGRAGLAPLPDGRLGFITYTSDDLAVWTMDSVGDEMRQLTGSPLIVEELRPDPLGRYFIFSSMKDKHSHLYRIDTDGNNLTQLTFGDGHEIDSSISPDGNWIAYGSLLEDRPGGELYRSTIDGGEATPFGDNKCSRPSYSPDGKYLSCVTEDDKKILLLSAIDGTRISTFDIPAYSVVNFGVRFTPDSSGLVFAREGGGVSNLWVQPLKGGKPEQLTRFTGGHIYRFEYSPDGSHIFLARGFPIQDVILIKNFL
jgi:Tol biopolymer transport system component/DNA-binding winged helix-turn-helix (wHTH) protein